MHLQKCRACGWYRCISYNLDSKESGPNDEFIMTGDVKKPAAVAQGKLSQ